MGTQALHARARTAKAQIPACTPYCRNTSHSTGLASDLTGCQMPNPMVRSAFAGEGTKRTPVVPPSLATACTRRLPAWSKRNQLATCTAANESQKNLGELV